MLTFLPFQHYLVVAMDSSTSVSTQPAPIPLPSTTTTSILPTSIAHTSTVTHPPAKFQFRRIRRTITALSDFLILVWIALRVVPVALGVVIGFMYVTYV